MWVGRDVWIGLLFTRLPTASLPSISVNTPLPSLPIALFLRCELYGLDFVPEPP